MGSRGPAPVPKAVLTMRGSKLARGRADTMQLPVRKPACRPALSRAAADYFRRYVKQLHVAGVVTALDAAAIEIMANLRAELDDLGQQKAALEKRIAEAPEDDIHLPYLRNRLWRLANQEHTARQLFLAYAQQYGLTPASRQRIAVPQASAGRVWSRQRPDLLSRKRGDESPLQTLRRVHGRGEPGSA
jgi:phage terminase small subunit